MNRRQFLTSTTIGALAAAAAPRAALAQGKTGTVRVWGEPGPYGGVAVDGMNEWAQKNAPGLKFAIETIPWSDVYPKLMTDLAAAGPRTASASSRPSRSSSWPRGFSSPSTTWWTGSGAPD